MGALRSFVASVLEWGVAAAVLVALVALGATGQRALSSVGNLATTLGPKVTHATTARVPERAVAVPMLILREGAEIRTGQSMTDVAALLGRSAETGEQYVDGTNGGERITRFYDHAGTRFILVFESRAGKGATVVGIYLQ
jgi:hypothetical protein